MLKLCFYLFFFPFEKKLEQLLLVEMHILTQMSPNKHQDPSEF